MTHCYENNNNHFMALCPDYLSEPVPEETFTYSHLFWSSTIQLPPSTMITATGIHSVNCHLYLVGQHYGLWSGCFDAVGWAARMASSL